MEEVLNFKNCRDRYDTKKVYNFTPLEMDESVV